MRISDRSVKRDRAQRAQGFSFLELMVATAILAIVLSLVLAQFRDGTSLMKQGTGDADLRRIGQGVLEQVAYDLRLTTAGNGSNLTVSSIGAASSNSISFVKVLAFDPTAGVLKFEATSPAAPALPTPIYTKYSWTPGTTALVAVNSKVQSGFLLCNELDDGAPDDAGNVHPGLVFDGTPAVPGDVPTLVTVVLNLRRKLGVNENPSSPNYLKPWYARVQLTTQVFIRSTK